VRVGYHTGAGAPRAARRAGGVALLLGVGYAAVSASVIILGRSAIPHLYGLSPARDADVPAIALTVRLLTIAAAFQLFDATQTIANGALRGLRDTRVPMLLAVASYWLCGFPVAWLLGFPAHLGAPGIWWGLALGLAVAAVLLTTRFWILSQRHCRTGAIEDAARQAFGPVMAAE
jgi:MATE family multidrug resistance protein